MTDKVRRQGSGNTDLDRLGERVAAFVAERDWTRFHSAKNLAMALSVEASELLELFQWSTAAESDAPDEERRRRAAEEIADVQIYPCRSPPGSRSISMTPWSTSSRRTP